MWITYWHDIMPFWRHPLIYPVHHLKLKTKAVCETIISWSTINNWSITIWCCPRPVTRIVLSCTKLSTVFHISDLVTIFSLPKLWGKLRVTLDTDLALWWHWSVIDYYTKFIKFISIYHYFSNELVTWINDYTVGGIVYTCSTFDVRFSSQLTNLVHG